MSNIILTRYLVVISLLFCYQAEAKQLRSYHAIKEFKLTHPCPADGSFKGRCEGYVIDHRVGLCVGGSDSPKNMRWMTKETAKQKDRWECKEGWKANLAECEKLDCFVK